MNLLDKFLTKVEHNNYEDFARDTDIIVKDGFNFGYDVVDEYARICPDKVALVWCNHKGEEKIITFGEMKVLSDKVANILHGEGVILVHFLVSQMLHMKLLQLQIKLAYVQKNQSSL